MWLGVHQCKISWKLHLSWKAQYLKYWLTGTTLQQAKQGLFSLIPEVTVHINFSLNLARFFRTPIFYCIDNHMQNRCSKKSSKIHGKTPLLESLFYKASGLRPAILLKRHFNRCFPVNLETFLTRPFLQNTFERLLR